MTTEMGRSAPKGNRLRRLGALAGHVALAGLVVAGTATTLAAIHAAPEVAAVETPTRPTPVVARPAEPSNGFTLERRFTGLIQAETVVDLGFEIDGRVIEAPVSLGDRVAAGAVLGRLDAERLEARLRQLDAQLDEARATLEFQETEYARAEQLLEQGSGTRQRFDEARSSLRTARATLDDLEAQRESLSLDIEDTTLEAPFDAVVVQKSFARGDVVSPARTVLRLMAEDSLEARVGVPAAMAGRFAPGDGVRLLWRGERVDARVRRVVPEIESASRTATLVLSLPEAIAPLAGETVNLLAEERIDAPGFWVPLDALVADLKGLWAVQVAEEDDTGTRRIVRAPVRVVHVGADRAYVAGALSAGDRIVTQGTNRVSPGEIVALAE